MLSEVCLFAVLVAASPTADEFGMEFLSQLFSESRRRDEDHVEIRDFDSSRPTPSFFGLVSFRPDEDLVRRLLEYERNLSPGTLRDIVTLTRMLRAVPDAQHQREAQIQELLQWLDTVPEMERRCLAMLVWRWLHRNRRWVPTYPDLAQGIVQRLPERSFGTDLFREDQLGHLHGLLDNSGKTSETEAGGDGQDAPLREEIFPKSSRTSMFYNPSIEAGSW